jgi:hypothetical protein
MPVNCGIEGYGGVFKYKGFLICAGDTDVKLGEKPKEYGDGAPTANDAPGEGDAGAML